MIAEDVELGLRLANRREHALLATVVKASFEERQEKNKSGGIGRTALQKIVYFLDVLEVPMRYQFNIYTYGPFCSEILSDSELLQFDQIIKDISTDPSVSSYAPGEEMEVLQKEHSVFLQKYEVTIRMVSKALGAASPNVLELYSTTDYVNRWLATELGRKPASEEVFGRVEELKPKKFSKKEKESAFDWLARSGLA